MSLQAFQELHNFSQQIYSYFPQNDHSKKVDEIDEQITSLSELKKDTTSVAFKEKSIEVYNKMHATLDKRQEEVSNRLTLLNGAYYNDTYQQDPNSQLKQAWDRVVTTTEQELGKGIQTREQLNSFQEQLKANSDSEANRAIIDYIKLEKERDMLQEQLKTIISVEKAGLLSVQIQKELVNEKETLVKRQNELRGNRLGDPNGLLDYTWKYDRNSYEKLEKERMANDARLFTLEQLLSVKPNTELDVVAFTLKSIESEIKDLKKKRYEHATEAGIDLQKALELAETFFANSLGYIVNNIENIDLDFGFQTQV